MTAKHPNLLLLLGVLISICCSKTISDSELQQSINSSLSNNGLATVTVVVKDGVVTLTGGVLSTSDSSLAETLARKDGVKQVVNNLTITPPMPTPEPELSDSESEIDNSLDGQAQRIAEEFWKKTLTKCGDSYYWEFQNQPYEEFMYECKEEPFISVEGQAFEPKELTEAEKLNKVDPQPVEWSGVAKVSFDVCRKKKSQKYYGGGTFGWQEWRDNVSQSVPLQKVKGEWRLSNPNVVVNFKYAVVPVACSDTAPQIEGNDLSATYAIVGNTIYNKRTMVLFTSPQQFFADSGKKSFDGLKYDVQSRLPPGLKFMNGSKLTEGDYKRYQK